MVEPVIPGNNGIMLQPPALLHQSSVNVDIGTISDARKQLVSAVPASAPPSVLGDVALVFSELAVNVIRHSGVGRKEQLRVRMYGLPQSVRIEVEDPGTGFDLPAMLPLQDDNRWGLRLVEAMAIDWGMRAGVRPPTVMWCELPTPS